MRRVGTKNPVFMLDEIDQAGADFRGDPSAALLECSIPSRTRRLRTTWRSRSNLSSVIVIATANMLDPIRRRCSIVWRCWRSRLHPRGEAGDRARHLVPKQIAEHGLTDEQIVLTNESLTTIIEQYTREAGVRNLEREVANVIRGVAV